VAYGLAIDKSIGITHTCNANTFDICTLNDYLLTYLLTELGDLK